MESEQVVVMTSEKRGFPLAAVILPLTWAAAGVVNANGFIMGGQPTTIGVLATLTAVCVWLVVGWIAGSQSRSRFVRYAIAFWTTVLAGTPLVFWALTVAPGRTVTQGGIVLPVLLFALMAPLYGLYALLPPWEPIVQGPGIGAAVFAMAMVAYLVRRHLWRRSAEAARVRPNKGIDADKPAV